MVITKTPFRVSLCGGGSDLPAFYEKNGGCVISTTIKKYMYIGGMPEVVEIFAKNKDYRLVRQKQKEIIDLYMSDIDKENRIFVHNIASLIWQKTNGFKIL